MLDFEDVLFEGVKFNAKASFGKKPAKKAPPKPAPKKVTVKPIAFKVSTPSFSTGVKATATTKPSISQQAQAAKPSFSWPKPAAKPAPKPVAKASGSFSFTGSASAPKPTAKASFRFTGSASAPKPKISIPTPKIAIKASSITPKALATISAQKTGKATITPARMKAATQVIRKRTNLATNIASKAISNLATKAPLLPVQPAFITAQKAVEAVTPIASACKCEPKPVIRKLNKRLVKKGYPANTATSLLAGIHDMNKSLEKAAIQRIATHEHKAITNEQAFRCKVLRKLTELARCLPECHPARTRAHLTVLRQG